WVPAWARSDPRSTSRYSVTPRPGSARQRCCWGAWRSSASWCCSPRRSGANSRDSAANVGLEVRDRAFLLLDDGAHQVADRNDADDLVTGQHWQMTDALVGHETHAIVCILSARHRNDFG